MGRGFRKLVVCIIPEKAFEKILVLGDGWQVQHVEYLEAES